MRFIRAPGEPNTAKYGHRADFSQPNSQPTFIKKEQARDPADLSMLGGATHLNSLQGRAGVCAAHRTYRYIAGKCKGVNRKILFDDERRKKWDWLTIEILKFNDYDDGDDSDVCVSSHE